MLKNVLLFSVAVLAVNVATAVPLYFNGFETDTAGWNNATQVPSGTGGIPSSDGAFHATTPTTGPNSSTAFTTFGGYNYGAGNAVPTAFQEYTTSIDIYLNVGGGFANDSRFDWSSAINNSSGLFLRDFIFNAGYYNDAAAPGTGPRFVISASNNSQPGSAFAKNPARNPIVIDVTGWYTFEHHFYNNSGVLAADLSIYDSSATLLNTWTLSNAGDAIAGVGGNRYGWFDYNQISGLAFDNSQLTLNATSVPETGATLAMLGMACVALAAFRRTKNVTA